MAYVAGKMIHLVALILWIGPPLGAYYLLYRAHREGDREKILWVERMTERVLFAEHVAFVILILSGLYLIWISDGAFLEMAWMRKKLALFGGVLLFELFDIYLAHVSFPRLLAQPDPFAAPSWAIAERRRVRLMIAGAVVGLGLIPGMIYLALAKH